MFELPWIAIFVLDAPWFWLLSLTALCLIIWALEEEIGKAAVVVIASFVLMLVFFGPGVEWMKWVAHNTWATVAILGGYVVAGSLWGVIKWYLYVSSERESYEDTKRSWLEKKGYPNSKSLSDEVKKQWAEYLCNDTSWGKWDRPRADQNKRAIIEIKPVVWKSKARIIRWMTYWPFSVIWTVLDDIVYKVFKKIQRWLSDFMDGITNYVFRGVDDDFDAQDFAYRGRERRDKR